MSDLITKIERQADRASDDYANEYPGLGFNPAPGAPANVESLGTQVQAAANALGEADRLLGQLRASSGTAWQGAAAEAFRGKVNTDLAPDLEHAQTSLTQAVGVLDRWCRDLVANKQSAAELDAQARRARAAQQQADQNLRGAMNDPGLALAGRIFTDQSELLRACPTPKP